MRQSHLMMWNAAVIWMTRVLQVIPQLIMVPFVIHRVGDVGYGVYALVWSLMMAICEIERSLQSGVIKYSAAFLAEGRLDEVNKVFSSSFVYSLVLGLIGAAVVVCAGFIPTTQSHDFASSLLVVGLSVPLLVPLTPYVAIIMSRQRHYVGALAETLSKYLNLLGVYIWFKAVGPSVLSLVVISAGLLVLSRLVQIPVAYRLVPGLSNRPGNFDWRAFRLIAAFGGMTVLASLCLVANSTGVRWLSGSLVSPSFVAHLAIILMPTVLLCQIVLAMTLPIMPAASAHQAVGDYRMLCEILVRSTRYSVIVVLAAVIAAALLMQNLFLVWVGEQFVFLSSYALAVFCSTAFWMSSSASHHMLKGMGKLRVTLLNALFGLVLVPIPLFLTLYFAGVNPYVAVSAGLCVGNVVYGGMQIGFSLKFTRVSLRELMVRAYLQPLSVCATVSAIAWGAVLFYDLDGLVGRLVIASLSVLTFLGATYMVFASPSERALAGQLYQTAQGRIASFGKRALRTGG